MKISKKIAGLTVAGVVAASGTAYAAVESTSSASTANDASSSHRYGSPSDRNADDRSRPSSYRPTPKMWMSGYFTVVHAHKRIAVIRLIGHHWRTVGWLKWNDRHVRGVWWPYRYTTTVIVVLGRRTAVTTVVRPNTVIVIADNGRIGIVPARYLRRWTPQPTASPSMTPTPTMTPSASPTPTPSGSQSAVVSGLQGRKSSKW